VLPASPTLDRALGDVAVKRGKFEEAIVSYRAALEKKPGDLQSRFRLGIAFRKMAKHELALAELDYVKQKDKDYPGLALERGVLFEQSGNEEKALEEFGGALAKAPNDLDLQLRVAAAHVALGKSELAITMLEKILKQRSASAEAHHYLGRAYLSQGGVQVTTALRFLKRAVELDGNVAEYHVYVAWAANEASPAQLSLAMSSAETAIKLDKTLGDGYWQRGATEQKQGALEDAIKDLKHALELKPARFEAHAALAASYEDKNQEGIALEEWSKAIAGSDKQMFWRYRYGKLLVSKKQDGQALPHLTYAVTEGSRASVKPGWLPIAAFELAEILRKQGRGKEALPHYEAYLQYASPSAPDRKAAVAAVAALTPKR
jgi:cellulose synthase operon protein C